MVRVGIVADRFSKAEAIAELLADDDRVEIVEVNTMAGASLAALAHVEVIVAAGVAVDEIPSDRNVVMLLDSEAVPLHAQARAWLPPGASASELVAAILAAASDFTVLTSGQAQRWIPGRSETGADRVMESLTRREMQVLRMLADGLGNKEIAGRLKISDHTAKFHVAQILAKFGASSRTEAVTVGIRRGLIPV